MRLGETGHAGLDGIESGMGRSGDVGACAPGIGGEMMVVAIGGEENRAGIFAGDDGEMQMGGGEVFGGGERGDAQMDVAEGGAGWEAGRAFVGSGGEETRDVERAGEHGQLPGALRPLGARSVGVEFEAVVIGIGEVDGFAHTVIGQALEFGPLGGEAAENAGEIGAGRDEEGEMEKAGGMVGRGGEAGDFAEREQRR